MRWLPFDVFMLLTTLAVLAIVPVWFVSPLGLGFAAMPTEGWARLLFRYAYGASYFVALPLLVVGQIAALLLYRSGWRRAAFGVPLGALAFFLLSAGTTLLLLGSSPFAN